MDKVYYLNDDGNIVPEQEATQIMIQHLDENGKLIGETIGIPESHLAKRSDVPQFNEVSPEAEAFLKQFAKGHREAMEAKRK